MAGFPRNIRTVVSSSISSSTCRASHMAAPLTMKQIRPKKSLVPDFPPASSSSTRRHTKLRCNVRERPLPGDPEKGRDVDCKGLLVKDWLRYIEVMQLCMFNFFGCALLGFCIPTLIQFTCGHETKRLV